MARDVYRVNMTIQDDPPTTRPYHHGSLRAALLEAARERLGEAADAELSLRELAARVGVSVNAAYRHFENKEALLLELATTGFDTLHARMAAAIAAAAPAPVERLGAAGEAYVGFALDAPALYRLMFGRRGRFDAHPRFGESAGGAFRVLVDCVAAIREQPADAPEVLKASMAAWSLVHGHATLAIDGYIAALPASHQPTVREVVRCLDVAGC